MTTYTFKLPKANNAAKIYKDALMERAITAYPWLTIDSTFDYPYSKTGVEYAKGGDYITLGTSCKHNISWFPKEFSEVFNNYNTNIIDLETDFNKALIALKNYAEDNYPNTDYDYKDIFGRPVFIFDNFIQIGYDVIPIKFGSLNHLKPKTKKLIIEIVIKIKKRGLL